MVHFISWITMAVVGLSWQTATQIFICEFYEHGETDATKKEHSVTDAARVNYACVKKTYLQISCTGRLSRTCSVVIGLLPTTANVVSGDVSSDMILCRLSATIHVDIGRLRVCVCVCVCVYV